jgi:nucleoside-diphosphate-sugar epimerase
MRVFVTGATGFIGEALVRALVQVGHKVTGLSRAEAKDAGLRALGATPLRGTLAEGKGWSAAAAEHDALVHTAFDYTSGPDADRAALDALLEAARGGTVKSLVFTSGVWVLGNCPGGADEQASTAEPLPMVAWRPVHEKRVLDAARSTLHTAVIRPGLVYGGHGSLTAGFFESATREGAARFVGDGANHVPYVHRDDLAQLYRKVLETAGAGVFHGVDGAALTVKQAAEAASRAAGAGGKTVAVPLAEARKAMGPLADALVLDQVVRAPRARALGWTPSRADFAQAAPEAFAEWKKAAGR